MCGSAELLPLDCRMSDSSPEAPLRTQHVTVDGIEGKYARIELPDGTTEDCLLSALPKGVKEGDVIAISGEGGDFELEVDHKETHQRRAKAEEKLSAVNKDAPTGEINL